MQVFIQIKPPPPPPPFANSHRFQHTWRLTFCRTLVWDWVADSVSVCMQTRYSGKQQKRAGKCDRLQSTHARCLICNTQTSYTWAESLLTAWPKAVKYKNTFAENIAHLNPIRFFLLAIMAQQNWLKKATTYPECPMKTPMYAWDPLFPAPTQALLSEEE